MRLHHLEITAFGPFADTVSVDFDSLSSAGLFLLTGPTGAGKTSVLDAVCFGLYGDVPGDRSAAKRLRSDQAPDGRAPRVVLEATLAGRRFKITRTPAWERPKRRGTGTTTEQASVVVQERSQGEWHTLATRLPDAGMLVTELLGMTLTQFTQVAMLPQGRFQAFLRARTEERRELLQKLFATGRFADVERWLVDHRIELRRRSEQVLQELAAAASRTSEAAGEALPDDWDAADLSGPASDGSLAAWSAALVEAVSLAADAAATEVTAAQQQEQEARAALDTARVLDQLRQRAVVAHRDLDRLEAVASEIAAAEVRLTDARRAAPVAAALRFADTARARAERAGRALKTLPLDDLGLSGLPGVSGVSGPSSVEGTTDPTRSPAPSDTPAPTALAAAIERARAECGHLDDRVRHFSGLLPRAERWAILHTELADLDAAAHADAAVVGAVEAELSELPRRITDLEQAVETAREARERCAVLTERLSLHEQVVGLRADVAEATQLHHAARDATLEARSHHLDVRQQRLEGMAAELAGALAVGGCCPVCGSDEHPAKAVPGHGAPGEQQERAAQEAYDSASQLEHLRDVEVRDLRARLEALLERLGSDADPDRDTAERDRLAPIARDVDGCTRRLEQARGQLTGLTARHSALRAAEQARAARRTSLDAEVGTLREQLSGALGTGPTEVRGESAEQAAGRVPTATELHQHIRRLTSRQRSLDEAVALLDQLAHAVEAATSAQADLEEATAAAGFATAQEVAAAVLDDAQVQQLERRVSEHRARRAAALAVLAEPGVEQALAAPPPDLALSAATHSAALDRRTASETRASRLEGRRERLRELDDQLRVTLAGWAPLCADYELAHRLASFAEGKSPDNHHQLSLSTYVVAYRLTQVVAAANERLATMADRRYELEHSAQKGARDRRGGLTLLVRDSWTGVVRDPATLSGGETFVVSLALALGLADVITQEAGGADLDTLFVDEGFGSLDADTLEDVMGTLDALRDGGRVVGVVSHVSELRERITAQLQVRKERSGSTLEIVEV